MDAIFYRRFGGSDVLEYGSVETPVPKEGQVLIELKASGVNPVDWKIREGYLKEVFPYEFPIIPGWEGAGIVKECGKGLRRCKVGEKVFGFFSSDIVKSGTYAQFIAVSEDLVMPIPKTLSFTQAASIPLAGLTAWQGLFDAAKLQAHETVMILGGAGGVGGMAVQFASWAKAKVFATAGSANHSYVLQLGAQKVFDYAQDDVKELFFAKSFQGADVVLDCVGGNALDLGFSLVKKGGRFVSVVEHDIQAKAPRGVDARFIMMKPNRDELHEIGMLYEHKKLIVPEIAEFPLTGAKEAQDLSKKGHVRGKLILTIS